MQKERQVNNRVGSALKVFERVTENRRKVENSWKTLYPKAMQFSFLNEKLSIYVLIRTGMHFIAMCKVAEREANDFIGKRLSSGVKEFSAENEFSHFSP